MTFSITITAREAEILRGLDTPPKKWWLVELSCDLIATRTVIVESEDEPNIDPNDYVIGPWNVGGTVIHNDDRDPFVDLDNVREAEDGDEPTTEADALITTPADVERVPMPERPMRSWTVTTKNPYRDHTGVQARTAEEAAGPYRARPYRAGPWRAIPTGEDGYGVRFSDGSL